ncbi:hypothetical protein BDN72DRAFT_850240 [Pluteus cervinus]|uniref:Uncharacterized protein n=1 Tax=Pluteus cervinus TaxID=181527 RepID=A0ACD3A584_9AGAR|nr:hypothetical protein BDN72DRAFT_850240 [Pluteus cervinus]
MFKKLVFALVFVSTLLPAIAYATPLPAASMNDGLDTTNNDPNVDVDVVPVSVEESHPVDNTYYVDADHLFSPYLDADQD